MATSSIDQAIQETFPVAVALHDGLLPAAGKTGTRNILASDGVYRELTMDWMVRVKRIAQCSLPYGSLQESLTFCIVPPPLALWSEFVQAARLALPCEAAAVMVWNTTSMTWRLSLRKSVSADADHIAYENAELSDDEVAVVDIHSHGTAGAFFSATDDKDDEGGIKIAAVVGKVDKDTPEIALRLQAIDERLPLALASDGHITERLPA